MIPREEYKNIVDKMPILCVDAVIVNEDWKYLLVKRNNEPLKGKWFVVGGRVLKGEKIKNAMIRKIKEEVGLKVDNIEVLGYYEDKFKESPFGLKSGVHTVSIVFSVKTSGKIKLDEQSVDYKWSKSLPKRFKIKSFLND